MDGAVRELRPAQRSERTDPHAVPPQAKGGLLTADPYPSSAAAFDKGTLAYLTRRPSHKTTAEGARLWEFGVAAHGPGAGDLAQSVAEAVRPISNSTTAEHRWSKRVPDTSSSTPRSTG
ncbi:hypothetical protein GCM10027294_52890 [Marinactinospora endophytica]